MAVAAKPECSPLDLWIGKKIGVLPLTKAAVSAYQWQKIQRLYEYVCAHSKFYGKFHGEKRPKTLQDWQQFQALPLLDATLLQEFGKQMICVEQEQIHRIVTLQTSGTTQKPKRVYFSLADQELTIDFFARGMPTLTKPGDVVMILLPVAREGSVGDLLAKGLERFGAKPYRYGLPQDFFAAAKAMASANTKVVVANPVQLLLIGYCYQALVEQGLLPADAIRLRSILLSTDYVAQSLADRLQALFGCPVYEHYGMTEMGLGGAVSCQALAGYHIRENDLYLEVIDPQTGQVLPDGVFGEVVFTTLTRTAMPLLRYRTGDWGRILAEPCPCGSVLRRLDRIQYRIGPRPLKITDFDECFFRLPGVLCYEAAVDEQGKTILFTVYYLQLAVAGAEAALRQALQPYCQGYQILFDWRQQVPQGGEVLQKRAIQYQQI